VVEPSNHETTAAAAKTKLKLQMSMAKINTNVSFQLLPGKEEKRRAEEKLTHKEEVEWTFMHAT